MASGDLYSLLGVDADISDDGLRRAYETQVSRAAKEGYQRRVLDLSNALDALPRGRGGVLYPSTRTMAHRVRPGAANDRNWRSWEPSSGVVASSARGNRLRSSRPGSRFLSGFIVGVLTTILVLGGAYVYLTKPRIEQGVAPAVAVVSRIVPPNQPVDPQGLVTVICQPAPGAAGYTFRARPGSTVTCNNGATPSF